VDDWSRLPTLVIAAEATKVSNLPNKKPKGANLTEAEDIRKALEASEIPSHVVPAIKKGTYNIQLMFGN